MNLMDTIYQKARAKPARMVFPEADDDKMFEAASKACQEGYIKAVFVGDAGLLEDKCRVAGLEPSQYRLVDSSDQSLLEELAERYATYPQAIFKGKSLLRRLADPLYLGLVLTAVDEADALFAGISHTTGDIILAGQTMVGLQEGINSVSSCGIMQIPGYRGLEGDLIAFGDSAVCQNPDPETLAGIAIAACDTVKTLCDWEPRCAMLSYSTQGSGTGELVDKVVEAVKLANSKRPDLHIEGEFQLDTAINPAVAKKKVTGESYVAGRANLVIYPDLNAGNIGVKLVQQFAQADAYGPMITGMNKVISDCSRSAPVSELVGNIALTSVRAMY